MTCCGFCLAFEFSQQKNQSGLCSLTLRHGRCSRWTYTRFSWSPLEQLCRVPVTQQSSGGWMGSVYLSSPSQSSFWKTPFVCLFSWVWLDIAVAVTHIFLLMIPQCLWGKKCNCSTFCCGQCIENASIAERGRVTFHSFCFYTSYAFLSQQWQQWLHSCSVFVITWHSELALPFVNVYFPWMIAILLYQYWEFSVPKHMELEQLLLWVCMEPS